MKKTITSAEAIEKWDVLVNDLAMMERKWSLL
jgi:hypothetical protein